MLSLAAAPPPATIVVEAQATPLAAIGVNVVVPGQQGAPFNVVIGPPGPPGAAATIDMTTFSGAAAGQEVALAGSPGALQLLVINGRVEFPGNYSISGSTLVIPAGLVWDGAPCMFIYSL